MFYTQPPVAGPTTGPGGLEPRATLRIKAINRTGAARSKGTVVVLDTRQTSTEVVSGATIGSSTHALSNFVLATNALERTAGIACVVEDASIADDTAGNLVVIGYLQANVLTTSGNTVKPGEPLVITSTGSLSNRLTTGAKVFALAFQQHVTTPKVAALKEVWFNGFGFPTPPTNTTHASGL